MQFKYGEQQTKNLIRKAQTTLNIAARFITKSHKRTSTLKLMKKCNWLSINEMIKHQSLITMWNLVFKSIPKPIHDHISINENNIITTRPARLKLVAKSFKHNTIKLWNTLPPHIRTNNKISIFKKQVRTWILECRDTTP